MSEIGPLSPQTYCDFLGCHSFCDKAWSWPQSPLFSFQTQPHILSLGPDILFLGPSLLCHITTEGTDESMTAVSTEVL
jgi:hypothetical protein